jgi:hypothetical protein
MKNASLFKTRTASQFLYRASILCVNATHDYFFRCYIYLSFRAEFAWGTWHRNNFPLRSWQVFIVRIEPMLRVSRLYTLGGVKHDFNTCFWSRVNWPGLRTRLFSRWRCINRPSLRWCLHTSHSDLRRLNRLMGSWNNPCNTFTHTTTACWVLLLIGFSYLQWLLLGTHLCSMLGRQPDSVVYVWISDERGSLTALSISRCSLHLWMYAAAAAWAGSREKELGSKERARDDWERPGVYRAGPAVGWWKEKRT